MKILILASLVFALIPLANASACQEEAQFMGTVKQVTVLNPQKTVCSFQIDFTQYQESMACPLGSGEASGTVFTSEGCNYKNGDTVSGYLVRDSSGAITWEGHH